MSKHCFDILPESRLIIVRYRGLTGIEDMKSVALEIWNSPLYDPHYNGIIDHRESIFNASPKMLEEISTFFLHAAEASLGSAAIIVTGPVQTALSYLFAKKMAPRNNLHVVSTWEAACHFVGHPGLPEPMADPKRP